MSGKTDTIKPAPPSLIVYETSFTGTMTRGTGETFGNSSVKVQSSICFMNSSSLWIKSHLHDHRCALALIDKSLTIYEPALIRGRARLLAQKAEAYYGLGFIDDSITIAEEALTLARSIGANKTLARVHNLHTALLQSPWRKERSIARLGAVLSL